MSSTKLRWSQIKSGFERPFWIANTTEIFERLSYYAVFSTLAIYLNQTIGLSSALSASLSGIFGGAVWVMAIFGGGLADRVGFRRALSAAYFILTCAYFLVGSIGAPWLEGARAAIPLPWLAGIILFLPALGVALVKPSVVGTTARASNENVRSVGYSIYYTMVNIGSALGPFLAGWLHSRLPPQAVFMAAALSVFAMALVVLVFFREPRAETSNSKTLAQTGSDFLRVIGNGRFIAFLLIFSGYWIVYWQQYLILPLFIVHYVDKNANTQWILMTDPLIVILFTVGVNAMMRSVLPFRALIFGSLLTSLSWLLIAARPSVGMAVLSLIVLAIGEIIQAPRYYEYVSRLAPAGQQGTYMGFAFLPIGIGSLAGGWLGGALLAHFGQASNATMVWPVLTGIGLLTTVLLWLYDRFASAKGEAKPSPAALL
jgi:POT family proton-dependent oligopeptide transporter